MSINFVYAWWIRSVTRILSIVLLWWCHRKWLFRGKLIIITLSLSLRMICLIILSIHHGPRVVQSSFLRRFSVTLLFLDNCHWLLGSLFHILWLESWITASIEIHFLIFVLFVLRLLFPLGMLLLIVANIVINLVIDALHNHSFLTIHLTFSSSSISLSIIVSLHFYTTNISLLFTIFEMNSWTDNSAWLLRWNI